MKLPNISATYTRLKQKVESDRVAVRIVRWGLLAIGFLLMTLVAFYAIDRWHTPQMPAGEDASDLQKGLYALLGSALLSALAVTVIAAWHPLRDATPIRRKKWFCPLVAGAIAVGIFCIGYIFLGVYPVGGKSILTVDLHHQYAPLLSELRYMLTEGKLDLSYNFHIGMGSSFIPAFAYYLASPLNILLVFFKESHLTEAILVITLVKFALAATAFTAMAQYLTRRRNVSVVTVGVLYALSGFMLAYSWNIMWLDSIIMLPLVVMAAEHLLKTGKLTPYALLLGLALFVNYYLGFMLCVFLVFYWLVWALRKKRTLKDTLLGGVRFAAGSLWGAGFAACLLIPVALALGRTSAAGGELGDFRTNFQIFDLFGRMFYGVTPTIRSGNLPNLYCGVAAVVLLPIYFGQKQISLRRRICYGGLLAIMLLSCTITRWDLVWHGLHAPNDLPYRFSFLTIFVVLLLAAYTLSQIKHITRRQVGISLAASAAYLVLWEKLAALNTDTNANRVSPDNKMLYINLLLLAVYGLVLLVAVAKKAPRRAAARLMLLVVCAELLFGTGRSLKLMNQNEYFTGQAHYIDNTKHLVINDALRRVEYLSRNEQAFLRMEYLAAEANDGRTTCVDTALHHYSGLTTFASSNPYCTTVLMGELGYAINGVNSYLYHQYVAPIDSLLGLRYVVRSDYLPNHPYLKYLESVSATDPDTDKLVEYHIYRNTAALPIGVVSTDALKKFEGTPYDPFGTQQDLYTSLTGLKDKIYVQMEIADGQGGTLYDGSFRTVGSYTTYNAAVDTKGQYYAYVDCRAADNITVEVMDAEGNILRNEAVTSYEPYILDLGVLNEGSNVAVSLSTSGSVTGNIYVMRLDEQAFEAHRQVLLKGGMTVTSQTGHSLKGKVTADKAGTMFFSLPYDEGWQVYVDGKKVKTFSVDHGQDKIKKEDGTYEYKPNDDGAFLAAEIPAGEHDIEIVYVTPGGKEGLLITGVSLLLLLVPLWLWIVRRRKALWDANPVATPDEWCRVQHRMQRAVRADVWMWRIIAIWIAVQTVVTAVMFAVAIQSIARMLPIVSAISTAAIILFVVLSLMVAGICWLVARHTNDLLKQQSIDPDRLYYHYRIKGWPILLRLLWSWPTVITYGIAVNRVQRVASLRLSDEEPADCVESETE